jgi:hypothetical protein
MTASKQSQDPSFIILIKSKLLYKVILNFIASTTQTKSPYSDSDLLCDILGDKI